MNKSKYLEELIEDCSEIRKVTAKRTLNVTIILIVVSIIAYVGVSSLDSEALIAAIMLSSIFGFIGLIFLIKFLLSSGKIKDKVLIKCEQEIEKNLGPNETFETFDNDITNPAFGQYIINGSIICIGHTFVLFQSLTAKGPHLRVLRGDNLGQFDVHYFSENGVGTDIGVDINDKNGKFIRSIIMSNKDIFYKLLNSLENIKSHANGEYIPMEQALGYEDNEFVEELKNKVSNQDRKGSIKLGILGVIFGLFLIIAAVNSGEIFAYAGIVLTIVSIVFIIRVNIKSRRK
ncbi:hypothetical protein VT91_26100 [Clostridium sporogenes]|uniref:hypothetical protein n=1 Tax=Clostridium botulinum TaxID=1491 RepID=UPI000717762B|nr:hypothetical protein [Clostridium botulinum]KRU27459.1 hypothetical protein VT28_25940 [Clostridium sporogenes]KRU27781.1 hypothetical protein VT91_26100 [Clostridium sporogenes]KRU32145.1 hypothetical protein WG71_01550 [Clostridium sporogenes]KRU45009.1 hypothetical protein VT95_12570 [Clostridium sporogenes]MBZ1330238.1 hypothetical protein [Clostridium botulinum]